MSASRKKLKSDWTALPGRREKFRWSETKQNYMFEDGNPVPTKYLPDYAVQRLAAVTDTPGLSTQPLSSTAYPNVRGNVNVGAGNAVTSATFSGTSVAQSHSTKSPAKSGSTIPQTTYMPGSTGYPDLRSLSGIREHTATDRRTQVQTKWIRSSGQTSTPNQTQQGNVKKFGETAGATEARFKEYKKREESVFKVGAVFEMLIALPSHTQISHVTTITAVRPPFDQGTRKRRFVIIRAETPDGSPGFLALPISTYETQGVAKHGVVKGDHAIVYTSRVAPTATRNELPRRLDGGGTETGMLPNPIRVRPRHPNSLGYALDPMARLNFGSIQSFDHGVKVKLFGEIHEDSEYDFEYQFRLVWQNNPMFTEQHYPAQEPGAAQPAAGPNAAGPSHQRNDSGVNFEGPVDLQEVTNALQRVHITAANQHLPAPPLLDAATQQGLAQDYEARKRYFAAIQNSWTRVLEHRRQQTTQMAQNNDDDDDDDDIIDDDDNNSNSDENADDSGEEPSDDAESQ